MKVDDEKKAETIETKPADAKATDAEPAKVGTAPVVEATTAKKDETESTAQEDAKK